MTRRSYHCIDQSEKDTSSCETLHVIVLPSNPYDDSNPNDEYTGGRRYTVFVGMIMYDILFLKESCKVRFFIEMKHLTKHLLNITFVLDNNCHFHLDCLVSTTCVLSGINNLEDILFDALLMSFE